MAAPATITRLPYSKAPKPPAGLKADGKRLWAELQSTYAICDAGGLLLLETAAKSFDDWSAARRLLEKDGMLIPDRQGGRKLHPAASLAKDAHHAMMQALRMLRLDCEPVRPVGRPPGSVTVR